MSKAKALIGVVVALMAVTLLARYRCAVDERRARDELLLYGREAWALARLNDGGFVPPELLVSPSEAQPDVHLLPPRFALNERRSYRFEFSGTAGVQDPEAPWKWAPAYRYFEYRAAPASVICGLCGARFFLFSSETMAVHASANPPSIRDHIVATAGDGVIEP